MTDDQKPVDRFTARLQGVVTEWEQRMEAQAEGGAVTSTLSKTASMLVTVDEIKLEREYSGNEYVSDYTKVVLRGDGVLLHIKWPSDDPKLGDQFTVVVEEYDEYIEGDEGRP